MSDPKPRIGIRREDKHQWERRVPLTPDAVASLVARGFEVVVQPSEIRVFDDEAYRRAGARVAEDLDGCAVVLAVKEIPIELFREDGAYVFFSHTIKGQAHNMPLLRRLMELRCTLMDYERIVDDQGRRLVFFGRHAGLAGMVDTLWATATRLRALGIASPFDAIKLCHEYADLDEVRAALGEVAEAIRGGGLPEALAPFVVGVTGYGNVSRGSMEILDLLPTEEVAPEDLPALAARSDAPRDRVFTVTFREEHMARRKDGSAFELRHYYDHPEAYEGLMPSHLPHLSVLVNGIYWTPAYPRVASKEVLRSMAADGHVGRLVTIGDIGCDIDGAVQCTVKATSPGLPLYVYDPVSDSISDGAEGPGVAMMTTDCLPCELSKDASEHFTGALLPYVEAIATADYGAEAMDPALPAPIRSAVILWRGELTPAYEYLREHLG